MTKILSFYKIRGPVSVILSVVLSVLVVAAVAEAATTISTNINTGGTLTVTGASTLIGAVSASSTLQVTGNQTNFGTLTVSGTGATTLGGALSVTGVSTLTGLATLNGGAESAVTRATGATGSFQNFAGDLTYQGAAGGTSGYHAGVMGNFLGDTLTNTNATIHAGTIGKYSVTTSDALVGPKAGLVGEAETSVANSAIMAVLGGDTGTVTPGAAYGVRYLNSTAASKFTYGLDLFSAAVGSYKAVDYGTADIRLQNGETISNATDGTINFGAANLSSTGTTAIGGGTAITKVVAASLADDASGWVPDGIATDFTITANAASITATSHVTISVGANATAATCGVYTKTAATSFKVKCSAAPANAATLEYMIVNF